MIEHIPEMVDAGIDSFKIEGRMKTALYVAAVARTYRNAIDDLFESEDKYRENIGRYKSEIAKCTYRQFTTGFYFGKPDENTQIYDSNTYVNEYTYLGSVDHITADNEIVLEQKNKFRVNDDIEIMKPDGRNITARVISIKDDEKGTEMDSCPHPQQIIRVKLSEDDVSVNDILRVEGDSKLK